MEKHGYINFIRGSIFSCLLLAFCFIFRVDIFANSLVLDETTLYNDFSKVIQFDKNQNNLMLSRYCEYWNNSQEACIFTVETDDTIYFGVQNWNSGYNQYSDNLKSICKNNGYTYICPIRFVDNNDSLKYYFSGSIGDVSDFKVYMYYEKSSGALIYNRSGLNVTSTKVNNNNVKVLRSSIESNSEYDSTLGYLTNVKVKRASPFLLTDMSTDFTNIIDRFSWGAVTSGGSSFDGVDIRIKTFKNEDILGEVETHINCPPDNYNFDWSDYIDLSLKDWVLGNLFRYEIYLRPTFGNKYGDYCYFNVGFPTSVNEQIEATLDPKYLTDSIQYVENVGYIDNFDNYTPPTDGTSLFVPNYVVPNKPIDDINKDLDDDNVVPSSSPSYTEIINNITIIQNGNEDGGSLIDKLGDLLSFFTNFLTFLYNFINLILSPLSFLPGWLKSLLSMSIIAFIVICIIKTVRG